ncbi:hypothetical protein OG21DRAFT_1510331 [Imleria badia]|nr:hypothetical protein OG21DRAFT_1510331 [Imleria badia]
MKKYRAGFALSNPPEFDLTKKDAVMWSSSQGSAGLSQLAKSERPSWQRRLADVKGKNEETESIGGR